eukprot:9155770-Pyramimonas_sp.AAC.1
MPELLAASAAWPRHVAASEGREQPFCVLHSEMHSLVQVRVEALVEPEGLWNLVVRDGGLPPL